MSDPDHLPTQNNACTGAGRAGHRPGHRRSPRSHCRQLCCRYGTIRLLGAKTKQQGALGNPVLAQTVEILFPAISAPTLCMDSTNDLFVNSVTGQGPSLSVILDNATSSTLPIQVTSPCPTAAQIFVQTSQGSPFFFQPSKWTTSYNHTANVLTQAVSPVNYPSVTSLSNFVGVYIVRFLSFTST